MGAGMRQRGGFLHEKLYLLRCNEGLILHILQSNQEDQAFSKTNFLSLHFDPERRIDVHGLGT